MIPPYRIDNTPAEQAARRKAGVDCNYCGFPIDGRTKRPYVDSRGLRYHTRCANA